MSGRFASPLRATLCFVSALESEGGTDGGVLELVEGVNRIIVGTSVQNSVAEPEGQIVRDVPLKRRGDVDSVALGCPESVPFRIEAEMPGEPPSELIVDERDDARVLIGDSAPILGQTDFRIPNLGGDTHSKGDLFIANEVVAVSEAVGVEAEKARRRGISRKIRAVEHYGAVEATRKVHFEGREQHRNVVLWVDMPSQTTPEKSPGIICIEVIGQ